MSLYLKTEELQENELLNVMESGISVSGGISVSRGISVSEVNASITPKNRVTILNTNTNTNTNTNALNYESEDENLVTLNSDLRNDIFWKKLEYKDVEYRIDKSYFDINHKYSSALDILASYLKGHKIIYMESKFFCETHLNMYMMPAILLSSAATVLTSFITKYNWGVIFIASLNGLIAFLLAIVNYLKLDAASEAHKISSHQYDKLQSSVEFTSGSVLLFRYNDIQKLENGEYSLDEIIDKSNLFIISWGLFK